MFTSNVPNAGNGVTVLAFTKGGTTATVIEIDKSVHTLIITTDQARDRASGKTLRARSNVARQVVAFLTGEAFVAVSFTSLVITLAVVVTALVITFTITLAVASFVTILVIITVIGFARRGRWVGRVGRCRIGVTAEGVIGPTPTGTALGRGGVVGRLSVRSTAAEVLMPRPSTGTVFAIGWGIGIRWTSVLETAVFTTPLELTTRAISSVSSAS